MGLSGCGSRNSSYLIVSLAAGSGTDLRELGADGSTDVRRQGRSQKEGHAQLPKKETTDFCCTPKCAKKHLKNVKNEIFGPKIKEKADGQRLFRQGFHFSLPLCQRTACTQMHTASEGGVESSSPSKEKRKNSSRPTIALSC